MAFEFITSPAGKVVGAIGDLTETRCTLAKIGPVLGDIPGEGVKFVSNPTGYVEKRLAALVDELGRPVVHAIRDGMGGVIGKALSEVGLRPLVDGIAYLAEKIETIVRELISLACVLDKQGNSVFWGLVAALVGARASGLVHSEADCHKLHETGGLAKLFAGPINDLVDCAITVAFKAPLPSPRAVEHSYTGGGQSSPCVFAVLELSQGPPQLCYLHWKANDAMSELGKRWADGWRFGQFSPYVMGSEVFCHYTLERTGADQAGKIGTPEQVAAQGIENLKKGYHYTSIGSYVLPNRNVQISAVWERTDFRPSQRAVFAKPLRWWQSAGKAADDPHDHGDPNHERRPGWVRYASPFVLDDQTFINAIIEKPSAPEQDRRLGFDLPFAWFVERDRKAVASNLANMFISPYVVNRELRVASLWMGNPTPPRGNPPPPPPRRRSNVDVSWLGGVSLPSWRLTLFGWRLDDFAAHMPRLQGMGYRIARLAGYVP